MTDFQKTINYLILQINETIQNEVTKSKYIYNISLLLLHIIFIYYIYMYIT